MLNTSYGDEQLVQYLLGELSDAERDRIEDAYFADDVLHEQLLAIESELIDSYVRGDLSAGQRVRFERSFLTSPEHRERVEFARALMRKAQAIGIPKFTQLETSEGIELPVAALAEPHAATPENAPLNLTKPFIPPVKTSVELPVPRASAWWRSVFDLYLGWSPATKMVFAAALLALVAAPIWILQSNRAAPPRMASNAPPVPAREAPQGIRQPGERVTEKAGEPLHEAQARESPGLTSIHKGPRLPIGSVQLSLAPFVALVLTSTVRGAGDDNTLSVPKGNAEIRLYAPRSGLYKRYLAIIETVEGRKIAEQDAEAVDGTKLAADPALRLRSVEGGNYVVVAVPSIRLEPGDYILRLSGQGSVGEAEDVGAYTFRIVRSSQKP